MLICAGKNRKECFDHMISFNTYRRIHKALAMIESGAVDGLALGRHDLDALLKMLKCAILTTECLFHYPLSPKKQTSDSDNIFGCIDFL